MRHEASDTPFAPTGELLYTHRFDYVHRIEYARDTLLLRYFFELALPFRGVKLVDPSSPLNCIGSIAEVQTRLDAPRIACGCT